MDTAHHLNSLLSSPFVIMSLTCAFLVGSIPTGYLIGKLRGIDVRDSGSGNVGATNVSRILGRRAGILTLVLDVSKGVLATLLPYVIGSDSISVGPLCGAAAVIGHCYSPFLKFRGGKGVATGLGVFLAVSPVAAIFAIFIFGIVVKLTRYVSVASMCAAGILPVVLKNDRPEVFLAALICAVVITVRHHSNIRRLFAGTENRREK